MSNQSKLEKALEELGKVDIKTHKLRILLFLQRQTDPIPINHLVSILGVSSAAVTGLIDSLERRLLITRAASKRDRRVTLISISEQASSLLRVLNVS